MTPDHSYYANLYGLSDADLFAWAIGVDPEGDLPLHERYVSSTAFVLDEGGEPIGTAFAVRITYDMFDPGFPYLVTAHHVVRGRKETKVRIRTKPADATPRSFADPEDLPIDKWYAHPDGETDVAVTPLRLGGVAPSGGREWAINRIPLVPRLYERDKEPIQYAEPIYFAGLFGFARGMGERMVPVVRSGTLAAWDERDLPLLEDKGATVDGHLIDVRSYSGFSGSPCFIGETKWLEQVNDHLKVEQVEMLPSLIGVVLGHVEHPEIPRSMKTGKELPGGVYIPANLGIAIVAPTIAILETLKRKELVSERNEIRKENEDYLDDHGKPRLERQEGGGIVLDSTAKDGGTFTRDAFHDALEKVSEPDEPQPDEASE